ncbi:MAG TPA: Asp23/Gls24 family envelope stress response protein [Thermotogota bacterium]|nr:Asp23/Gls24 family envelope stress response protein [Thermotogota bacterium]HRW92215.1 Asp23/Gls24 family envelope stress response protein [Thermotogota bacterium]
MKLTTQLGEINIGLNVVKELVFQALLECYGLKRMDDPNIINKFFGGQQKGIHVREDEEGLFINVYPVASYGAKMDQVALNAQQGISYKVEQMLGMKPRRVNIHFLGIDVE